MWRGLLVTKILLITFFISELAISQIGGGGTFYKRRGPSLNFSTSAQTLAAGICSEITTVTTPAPVTGAPLTIDLTSSGSVLFFSDPACTLPITSLSISIGLSSASFYFLQETVSNPNLTASAVGYGNANQTATIQTNPFIWTGGGGNALWATGSNWSGGVAPNSTQVAVFNSSCVSNCSPTIGSAITVQGIIMKSGYSGTITQSNGVTISVGVKGWVMQSGTFVGGNSSIGIDAIAGFQLLGGTFTSTSGVFQIAANTDATSRLFIMPDAGATFNHNSGTVTIKKYGAPCAFIEYIVDVPNNQSFHNFTLDAALTGCGGTQYFVINQGKAINVLGTFSDNSSRSGINGGTVFLHGNYASNNTTYGGGSAVLMFVGLANQTYQGSNSGNDYATANVKINKPLAGNVTPANANTWGAQTFEIIAGNFTAPSSTFFVGRGQFDFLNIFKVPTGTTYSHNNGTLALVGSIGTCSAYTYNIDVPNNFTINHLRLTRVGGSGCGASQVFNFMNGSTVRVLGNLEQNFGQIAGNIEFSGNYSISGATGSGGAGTLKAVGTGDQIFTTSGASYPTGGFVIEQSGAGRVILGSSWSYSGRSWNLVSGTVYMSGFNLTLQGLTLNGNTIRKRDVPGTSASGVLTVNGSVIANGAFLGGTVAD